MLLGWIQIALTLIIVVAITPYLGRYIAAIFLGKPTALDRILNPIDRTLFMLMGMRSAAEMTGWEYVRAVLYSNGVMLVFTDLLLMNQEILPLNPTGLKAPSWHLALHTAISFVTNTDQQHYAGETTLSYLSQCAALGFLMFTSAATGIAVAIAFIRGLTGQPLGNFYRDLVLAITRLLLPMSIVGAIVFMAAGIPETLAGPALVPTLENPQLTQAIARGPIAHLESIKALGENGGGFFAINSAHPFENPNGLTNLIQLVALISIPSALIITYGIFAHNLKQAWLAYSIPLTILIGFIIIVALGEYHGNSSVQALLGHSVPNLEGKEIRFGWAESALFSVFTTATMCGAVNSMHDSFMPSGGFVMLSNMFLQMVFGGQGTGTAYLFCYLILAVFVTGLMVGRTPEFLGRKIEKQEVILASFLLLLVHPIAILIPAAITFAFPETLAGISNPGFHGLSQVIYEYTSAAANNGSGFQGLGNGTLWWNLSASFSLLVGRYIPIVALLLLADNLSRKQPVPTTVGTLRTDTWLFTAVTAGVILILGALTFFPALALGPVAEAFQLIQGIASRSFS